VINGDWNMWNPISFLSLSGKETLLETARVVLVPVPYDNTTTYKTGARDGPLELLRASAHLEDFDHELGIDVAKIGIHTTPFLEPVLDGPQGMIERIHKTVLPFVKQKKIVGLLGGDHTITLGSIQAYRSFYPDLSVLYFDAHGDLRDSYMGSKWGHANVARRISEVCPVIEVGVRSISEQEANFIQESNVTVFFNDTVNPQPPSHQEIVAAISSPKVYISVDLDCLDPSLMPAVGTPEPGGMSWSQLTGLIEGISKQKEIVGFDVVELSPDLGPAACSFTAAKLVYKLITYASQSSLST